MLELLDSDDELVSTLATGGSLAGLRGPVRYRARLVSAGSPVLQTPYLDSVTLTVLVPARAVVWRWVS